MEENTVIVEETATSKVKAFATRHAAKIRAGVTVVAVGAAYALGTVVGGSRAIDALEEREELIELEAAPVEE